MITKVEIENIIQKFGKSGNLFLCERQFQFDLAQEILKNFNDCVVHLEFPSEKHCCNHLVFYDIVIEEKNQYFVIELKYKTRKADITYKNNKYSLKNQSAQDFGRFDFLKDISRIEQWNQFNPNRTFVGGVAVILTNDSSYWEKTGENCNYEAFALKDETTIVAGKKEWGSENLDYVGKARKDGLNILNDYDIKWVDYHKDENNEFRYLLEEIKTQKSNF